MIDLWFSCLGDFVSIDVQCLDFAEEFAMFRLERNYWNLTPVAFTIVMVVRVGPRRPFRCILPDLHLVDLLDECPFPLF